MLRSPKVRDEHGIVVRRIERTLRQHAVWSHAEPEPFVARDPAFPAAATKIIGKLLKKDPENRYQTARDLLAHLEELDTPTARFPTSASR